MSIVEDEQESWRLLLEEAEREGEFNVNRFILQKQEEATNAYNHVPQVEAPQWLQSIMLAEIALQLERIATQLEDGRLSLLEGDDIVGRLSQISSVIQDK